MEGEVGTLKWGEEIAVLNHSFSFELISRSHGGTKLSRLPLFGTVLNSSLQ